MTLRYLCVALLVAACSGDKKAGGVETPGAVIPANGSAGGGGKVAPDVDQRESRGAEHGVFSLVDNRLLAHAQYDGGLLIPAGSAGFAKYTRFRKAEVAWELRKERDGKKVAVIAGKSAAVRVPLTTEQAAGDTRIRMHHYAPAAGRMTLRINGKDLATVEQASGWSTSDTVVPAGNLRAGENEITLFASKGGLEVAWIQVGGASGPEGVQALYDAGANALVLDKGQSLAWYAMVPAKGTIVADVLGKGCKLRVEARPQSGKPIVATLSGKGSAAALDALGGAVARIELSVQGCDRGLVAKAELTVPGGAAVIKSGDKPKYIVFWIMDSLRADRISTFVPGARPEVPSFDELAKTSAVFVKAYVQGNESRVSHASIWSSLYPVRHNMLSSTAKLADKWFTLDEAMKKAKLFTSGVSGNGYIVQKWGFGDDWDRYSNHIHEGGGLSGEAIYLKALKSVEDKLETPWFLYVGTIDTHVSWRAKDPWMSRYSGDYNGKFKTVASGADMGKVASGKLKISDSDKDHIRAIYDSNVSYQDDLLRQLFEKLDEWKIRDQTMVVITADHGDEQWEVGRVGHGGSLRESLVHVPLLIYYPPLFPTGKIADGVETIDILPTLADVMGVPADKEWQGESLVPLANGVGAGYPRMMMSSQYEGAHAVRMGPWKLRVAGGAKPQLFNLEDNPNETKDVVDDEYVARRFLDDPLWLLRVNNDAWRKSRWGNPSNVTPQFAADMGE